jgi:hypothetical protein
LIPIIRAERADGHCHELTATPQTEFQARRTARRAAELLGRVGTPDLWRGGKLVVLDATDRRLIFACRISIPTTKVG